MSSILISLSPNTEKDDVSLAWHVLLHPGSWRADAIIERIEKVLTNRLNGSGVVMVSSGRSAIYRLLQAYGVGKGDEVIIQAFTCLAVVAPIKWCGAVPVFADINEANYNFDVNDVVRKITAKTRAIIIQHTFGSPGPILEILSLAKNNNILVIEDLAHAFGVSLNGRPLGTFGDAAIISFGRDKTISCVFGGAVVSQDRRLIQAIKQQQKQLALPPRWWVAQQLLHPLILSVVITMYFRVRIGQAMLVSAQKVRLLSMAVGYGEKKGGRPAFLNWQVSPALLVLLEKQLQKIDIFIARRREIAKQYASALSSGKYHGRELSGGGWLRFPYKVKDRRRILDRAKSEQIILGDWYKQPVMPVPAGFQDITGYGLGSCPVAEEASRSIVNLPTHIRMSDEDVDRVIEFIEKYTLNPNVKI